MNFAGTTYVKCRVCMTAPAQVCYLYYVSIYGYFFRSIYLCICLSACLSVCLVICISIYLSIHNSFHLFHYFPSIHVNHPYKRVSGIHEPQSKHTTCFEEVRSMPARTHRPRKRRRPDQTLQAPRPFHREEGVGSQSVQVRQHKVPTKNHTYLRFLTSKHYAKALPACPIFAGYFGLFRVKAEAVALDCISPEPHISNAFATFMKSLSCQDVTHPQKRVLILNQHTPECLQPHSTTRET